MSFFTASSIGREITIMPGSISSGSTTGERSSNTGTCCRSSHSKRPTRTACSDLGVPSRTARQAATLTEPDRLPSILQTARGVNRGDGGESKMPENAKTFSSVATRLPAQDLTRARRWYAEKLGLEPVEERPGGLRYRIGEGEFSIFTSAGRSPGTFTQF